MDRGFSAGITRTGQESNLYRHFFNLHICTYILKHKIEIPNRRKIVGYFSISVSKKESIFLPIGNRVCFGLTSNRLFEFVSDKIDEC